MLYPLTTQIKYLLTEIIKYVTPSLLEESESDLLNDLNHSAELKKNLIQTDPAKIILPDILLAELSEYSLTDIQSALSDMITDK